MKQTLLIIIIAVALGGCRNQDEYERGYENGALSCASYNYRKGDYPSMGFREYLRKKRIRLPHDEAGIDSIYKAYLSRWEDREKVSVYSEDTTLTVNSHWCALDSCPHIIIDTALKSEWTDGVRIGPKTSELKTKWNDADGVTDIQKINETTVTTHGCNYGTCPHIRVSGVGVLGSTKSGRAIKLADAPKEKGGGIITPWTDASKAERGNKIWFEGDTVGEGKRIIVDKYGTPIKTSGTLMFYLIDSLGNIIEDTIYKK